MWSTEKAVAAVVEALYRRFGVRALCVLEDLKNVETMAQRLAVPWLLVDIVTEAPPQLVREQFEAAGVAVGAVSAPKSDVSGSPYLFLAFSELYIGEAQALLRFSFGAEKGRLAFEFLKAGKSIYYASSDLRLRAEQAPAFYAKLYAQMTALEAMGISPLTPLPPVIAGVCDLKTLKGYAGQTVVLAASARLTPLAQEQIDALDIQIIRRPEGL